MFLLNRSVFFRILCVFFTIHVAITKQVTEDNNRKCHEQYDTKTPHSFHFIADDVIGLI